ncbi:MAG: TolC family protein, partial [Verrucomicrobiae bacterium]|nr:TolC family protein [Verrucomicrobiae bacterium]
MATHLRSCSLAAALAVAAAWQTGCTVGPDYQKPESAVPGSFKAPEPWRKVQPSDDADKGEWWMAFGDGKLNELQDKAAKANPSAKAAFYRAEEARAAVRIDRAALYPTLFTGLSGDRERGSETASTFASGRTRATVALPLDLEYELDLWGKLRRQVEASEAEAEAAEADYRNALLSLQ